MSSIVILRVKSPGREAIDLLERIESEFDVEAQPQTAGFVPVSVAGMSYEDAHAAVLRVLEGSDVAWREHLELLA